MTVQHLAPTKRKKISKREAAKIFLAHNGICCNCGRQITSAENWFIEHPDALILGGPDTAANRRPAHVKCKADKDRQDAKDRAKRDTIVTKHWQRPDVRKPSLRGPGFQKAKPQRKATTPRTPKFEGDIMARRNT